METPKQVSRRKIRRYDGNPLAYYESHSEEFSKWKTRKQLAIGDSGMYMALLRASQLEEAIPEINKPLSDSKINKIIADYEPCKGNAVEAARHLPYSEPTIRKYWKREGLIPKPKGGIRGGRTPLILSKEDENFILNTYFENRNISKTSRILNYSFYIVRKYLVKNNVEVRKGRPPLILSKEDETLILDTYFKNRDILETSRITNYSFYIVKKCLVKNNVAIKRERPRKVD